MRRSTRLRRRCVATCAACLLLAAAGLPAANTADDASLTGSPAATAKAPGQQVAPASPDAAAEVSDAEGYAALALLLLLVASPVAIRWLTQRRIQQRMNQDSLENDEACPQVSDQRGVAMTVVPRFEMHDKAHGLEGAIQARERFVGHSLSLFRRFVLLDVVAGSIYVILLSLMGHLSIMNEGGDMPIALGVIVGMVYPLLAGLRYLLYRRQFRPLDVRFRRRLAPLQWFRWALSPKFQAVTAGLWVALMVLLGLMFALDEDDTQACRAVATVLMLVALAQPVVVWRILRRMQREAGISLTVLRVFGIDANGKFTFGRILAFWQHFGNHFTVLDPSIWRHRYPLFSWRTAFFIVCLGWPAAIAGEWIMDHPQWEPLALRATVLIALVLMAGYALLGHYTLSREFIRSRQQLVGVLERLALRPRRLDLSFRRLEVMCHNNTWKIAVQEFARRSQVLLMDLRGYSSARRGCEYEVDFLLDAVPLSRILFLVDDGGDHDTVRQLILDRWRFLSPDSPNLDDPDPVAKIYVSSASDEADVQGILDLLIHAAQSPRSAVEGVRTAA